MNSEQLQQLDESKKVGNWPDSSKPRPEQAAREVLRFLLTYAVLNDMLTTHPPELLTPEQHKLIRDSENATWGLIWEDGPENWAVKLSLGEPLSSDNPATKCDTTRHGCYAEPHYGFDLFWYPS